MPIIPGIAVGGTILRTPDRSVEGATHNLVALGDSITVINSGTNFTGYAKVLAALLMSNLGITASYSAFGMNGASWLNSYSQGPYPQKSINDLAPFFADAFRIPGLVNKLFLLAGSNGMFLDGNSSATEFANFQTSYGDRLDNQWTPEEINVISPLPRQNDSAFNTKRLAYTDLLVTFGASEGFTVIDVSQDDVIDTAGNELDTDYYQPGGIHLNGTGHTYLATDLIYPNVFA